MEFIAFVIIIALAVTGALACDASYRSGVVDTFYELNENGHPGAWRARQVIAFYKLELKPRKER